MEITQVEGIEITPLAAKAVQDLLDKRDLAGEGYALRVFISGGGCAGYQYGMALDKDIRETDHVFESNGVTVVVDEISMQYLHGSRIDYVDDLMGSGFKIDNPNAVSTCGCGHSFRTEGDTAPSSGGGCSCGV